MKTILVTGGTGFIGSNLCHRLIADGERVICLDNNYTGSLENVQELLNHPRFTFVEHDVIEPWDCPEKLDRIYNLACPASPPHYQGRRSIFTTKTCVLGVLNMLALAKRDDARILQASTSEVYGEPLVHPQVESYRGNVNPHGIRACYDEGKRCAESLMLDHYRHEGVDIRVIRIFNTYGPKMNPDDGRVVSNFICQALRGQNITIYGEGHQTRSFQYIDDLLDGMIKMMENDHDFVGPVNLGNPEEFTIIQLARRVLSKLPESSSQLTFLPLPGDDPTIRRPDISLAVRELAWAPTINLNKGLDLTIEYFRNKLGL